MNKKEKKTVLSRSIVSNYAFVLSRLWQWNKLLILYCLLQIPLQVLIPFTGIYFPKIVLSEISNNATANQIIIAVGCFALLITVLNFLHTVLANRMTIGQWLFQFKFMIPLSSKLIDTDYENLESQQGQDLRQKAFDVVAGGGEGGLRTIIGSIVELVSNLFGFLLYGSILSLISPYIVLLLITSTAINYLVIKHAQNYEYKNRGKWIPIDRKINYLRTKSGELSNAKDIRLYSMGDWFKTMYRFFVNDRLVWTKRVAWRFFLAKLVDGLLIFLRDGVAYAILIYMIVKGTLTIANFVLYFGAIAGFSSWLSGIITQYSKLSRVSLRISDLRDFLDMPDSSNHGKGIALPPKEELPCSIEFKNLSYRYKEAKTDTLKNINIKINKGEKIAIVGLNGAGKTTLVKVLCGMYRPTGGKILLNGNDSAQYNIHDYYSLFSIIFQDNHLLPASVAKNVSLCDGEKVDRTRMEECLRLAGLEEKLTSLEHGSDTVLLKSINENAMELSGGELQKLMLARAIYKDAPIIILDEPTAALDPIAENELYMKYNDLTKNRTSVFISHRLSSTRFCDRIIYLENGEIAEVGSHEELMKAGGQYANMFDIQSHYYKSDYQEAVNE